MKPWPFSGASCEMMRSDLRFHRLPGLLLDMCQRYRYFLLGIYVLFRCLDLYSQVQLRWLDYDHDLQFLAWFERMRQSERVFDDFVPFYGPLLLYFSYPLFYLVGGGILGTNVLIHVIWPCLSLACAIGVAHLLFETPRRRMAFLLFVGILDLPFIHYTSFLRVWIGILAAALWARGIGNGGMKYVVPAGAVSALSFLFSPEVGIYVLLAIFAATVSSLSKTLRLCPPFLAGFAAILGPYALASPKELSLYLNFALSRTNYNWYSGSLFPSLAPTWPAIAFWGALFLQIALFLSLFRHSPHPPPNLPPEGGGRRGVGRQEGGAELRAVVALSVLSFTTAFSVPSLDHLRYSFPPMAVAVCLILSRGGSEKEGNGSGSRKTWWGVLVTSLCLLTLAVVIPLFVLDKHSSPGKTLFDIGVTVMPREWKTVIKQAVGIRGWARG
ncbi:MAG: hypothetical protein HYU64_20765, partial [Armatimonadetes bacterium]|nr:hypothetical protein [Armatimonadota bacterium]